LNTKKENKSIKDFFTKENLPKIIEYSAYVLAGAIVFTCIIATINKKRKNKHN